MFDHLSITASDLDRAQTFYAAFVRDPDGNRLAAVTRQPEEQP